MAHSVIVFLVFCIAAFAVAEAANCYDYSTYGTCVGKPCGSNGKCYWKIYIGKRAADEKEGAPEISNESEEELDREKRYVQEKKQPSGRHIVTISSHNRLIEYPDYGPNPPTAECLCCTKTCTAPKTLSNFCQCVCPSILTCTGGKIFDHATCQCKCPPNSYWDSSVSNCVGDCKWLTSTQCAGVRCNINKHLNCIKSGSSCLCPSCHNVYSSSLCYSTKCTTTYQPCLWKYYPYPYYYHRCSCY